MTDKELKEFLCDLGYGDDTKIIEGISEAFVGISCHDNKIVYDEDKILSIKDGEYILDEGDYYFMNFDEVTDEDAIVLFEEYTKPAIIGSTIGNHVVYDYEKLTQCFAEAFAKDGEGKDFSELSEDKQAEYRLSACEWIDYNTIRSLPYDLGNGKPMPIVIDRFENYV